MPDAPEVRGERGVRVQGKKGGVEEGGGGGVEGVQGALLPCDVQA